MKKRIISLLLILAMVISLVPNVAVAQTTEFAGGSGTEADPYLISSTTHLNNVRNYLSAYFKMTCDIEFADSDFSEGGAFYNDGAGFAPIGTGDSAFTGTFDGNGFAVKNLYICAVTGRYVHAGLFGYNSGTIKNLGIDGGSISAVESSVYVDNAGAVVGYNVEGGFVENCYNTATVKGQFAGGIVGSNIGTVTGCYNTGDVANYETTSTSLTYIGGICGENSGTITSSYNNGNVSSIEYAGGITGKCSGEILKCYNSGTISSSRDAGGISGHLSGSASDCYNAGTVAGKFSGGIVGYDSGSIVATCYNVGDITGNDVGGLFDYSGSATVTNCYYIDNVSVGAAEKDVGTKCTSDQLKTQSTYTGFDFETIWEFDSTISYDYPVLQSIEYKTEISVFAGGSGTDTDPYLVSTAAQLNEIRNYLDASFKLINDIEFTEEDFALGGAFYNNGAGFAPIGTTEAAFTGTFDGSGFAVKNIYIKVTTSNVIHAGLFGCNGGTIKNLGIDGGTIHGAYGGSYSANAGSVAGFNDYNGLIQNCYNTAAVSGQYAGGIVGVNRGIVTECYNSGTVTFNSSSYSSSYTGGIVAYSGAGSTGYISKCYNVGDVTGKDYAGGIVGTCYVAVQQCYNSGKVLATTTAGGILGSGSAAITDNYNAGEVTGKNVGGIIAYIFGGNLKNCYNVGTLSGTSGAGGVIYRYIEDEELTLSNCYYLDNVDAGCVSGDVTVTKCTSAQLKTQSTYIGFDFETIWEFDSTLAYEYPVLQCLNYDDEPKKITFAIGTNLTGVFNELTGYLIVSGTGDWEDGAIISDDIKAQIKTVEIKDGVTSIGKNAFYGCSKITSVNISNTVTSIGLASFYECTGLTAVTIPNSVKSIKNHAFYGCNALTNIIIPDSVISLGTYVFTNCSSLEDVTISNNITTLANSVFSGCKALKSISIPNNIETIGNHAFYQCSSLTSVVIPEGVISLGGGAFSLCTSLAEVSIPKSVELVGVNIFSDCDNLTDIYYGGSNSMYATLTNLPIVANMHYAYLEFAIGDNLVGVIENATGDLVISGTGDWEDGAAIPNDIKLLITAVEIQSGVTSIGNYAFLGCNKLFSLTIADGVTAIGDFALFYCASLKTVSIPSSVTAIGFNAFVGCDDIDDVYYGGDAHTYAKLANAPAAANLNCNKTVEHDFEDVSEKAATCTEDGHSAYSVCTICGHTEGKTDYAAEGHSYTTKQSSVQATDTTYYVQCDNCDSVSTTLTVAQAFVTNEQTGESYSSLEEAINAAKSGETVKLTADATVENVVINPGVTVDLNGCKLTAERVVGYADSNIVDNGAAITDVGNADAKATVKTGGLYAPKNKVILDENNAQLPIYDSANGCYVFVKNTMRDDYIYYDYDLSLYIVTPIIGDSNGIRRGMVKNVLGESSIGESGFSLVVRVAWASYDDAGELQYEADQNFTFTDKLASGYIEGYGASGKNNYSSSLSAEFKGDALKQADYVYVSTVLKSSTGVEIHSSITEIDTTKLQ